MNIKIETQNYDYGTLYKISEYILRTAMPREAKHGNIDMVYFLNDLYLALDSELKSFIEEE